MVDPAVVTAVRAPFAAARSAALRHLELNGLDVPELAAEVARRLSDEDQAVRDQALRTFLAVGSGALAAVPVLTDAIASGDSDLRGRALRCLEIVGPVARRAVPHLAELLEHPDHGPDALAALVAIAPEHPALPRVLGEALFEPEYAVWSRAAEALALVDPSLLPPVIEHVVETVRDGSGADHTRAVRLLAIVAPLWPAAILPVACELLEEDDAEHVRPALAALTRIGAGAIDALPGVLARLRRDPEVRDAALEAIAAMGPEAGRAVPILCELVAKPGDVGLQASCARALRPLSPDGHSVVPVLAGVLRAGLMRGDPADFWAIGEVAETIGTIGHDVTGAAQILEETLTAAIAARSADADSADELAEAVLRGISALGRDARRVLPTLLTLLDDPTLGPAAASTIPAVDGSRRSHLEVETAGFPWVEPDPVPESEDVGRTVSSTLRAEELSADAAAEMAPARDAARRFAGAIDSAPAEEIVRSIAWALGRAPAASSDDEVADRAYELGVLWGDQVVRAAGWSWAELCWQDGSAPAIVSPDRAHACFPTRFLADTIEGARAELVTLVFDRIRLGDLPRATPGSLAIVG